MPRKLQIARVVSRSHGEAFAAEWYEQAIRWFDAYHAFVAARVVEWPETDEEAQSAFHDIESEILRDTFDAMRPAAVEAFTKAAQDALTRWRAAYPDEVEDMIPPLDIPPRVTAKHGERFAEKWCERSFRCMELRLESFEASGLIEWPEGDAAQARFQDIEDELMDKTIAAMQSAASEAFINAAREVLTKERRRT